MEKLARRLRQRSATKTHAQWIVQDLWALGALALPNAVAGHSRVPSPPARLRHMAVILAQPRSRGVATKTSVPWIAMDLGVLGIHVRSSVVEARSLGLSLSIKIRIMAGRRAQLRRNQRIATKMHARSPAKAHGVLGVRAKRTVAEVRKQGHGVRVLRRRTVAQDAQLRLRPAVATLTNAQLIALPPGLLGAHATNLAATAHEKRQRSSRHRHHMVVLLVLLPR